MNTTEKSAYWEGVVHGWTAAGALAGALVMLVQVGGQHETGWAWWLNVVLSAGIGAFVGSSLALFLGLALSAVIER